MDPALLKERELFKLKASAIPVYVHKYYSALLNSIVMKLFKKYQELTKLYLMYYHIPELKKD